MLLWPALLWAHFLSVCRYGCHQTYIDALRCAYTSTRRSSDLCRVEVSFILGKGSIVSGNGLYRGIGAQWHQVQGINICTLAGVDIVKFVSIIGVPHGYCPLYCFLVLGRAEAIFIKV